VMLDVLMEPVAVKFGMWGFDKNRVPLVNYIAWFVISFPLILLFLNLKAKVRNELAPYAFCVITGFFLVANLF
ncbi:MAG TPA: carotenoid biosynthesis protein, partial [Chitinophagales bacterium]|nr:carotenoid biosynthesis protein [Chitinophagales bacterium]